MADAELRIVFDDDGGSYDERGDEHSDRTPPPAEKPQPREKPQPIGLDFLSYVAGGGVVGGAIKKFNKVFGVFEDLKSAIEENAARSIENENARAELMQRERDALRRRRKELEESERDRIRNEFASTPSDKQGEYLQSLTKDEFRLLFGQQETSRRFRDDEPEQRKPPETEPSRPRKPPVEDEPEQRKRPEPEAYKPPPPFEEPRQQEPPREHADMIGDDDEHQWPDIDEPEESPPVEVEQPPKVEKVEHPPKVEDEPETYKLKIEAEPPPKVEGEDEDTEQPPKDSLPDSLRELIEKRKREREEMKAPPVEPPPRDDGGGDKPPPRESMGDSLKKIFGKRPKRESPPREKPPKKESPPRRTPPPRKPPKGGKGGGGRKPPKGRGGGKVPPRTPPRKPPRGRGKTPPRIKPSGIGGGAGALVRAVGPVGIAAGAAAAGLYATVVATNKFVDAANNAADQLGKFAPQTTFSQAKAEIRQTTGDIARANVIDPSLARFIDIQSEFSQDLQDLKTAVLKVMLDVVVPILERIHRGFEYLRDWLIENGEKAINLLVDLVTFVDKFGGMLPGVAALTEKAGAFAKEVLATLKDLKQDDQQQFGLDPFFMQLLGTDPAPVNEDNQNAKPQIPVKAPAF